MPPDSYSVHPRSQVHRRSNRASYDAGAVHSIVNQAPILHVSFLPSDYPNDPFPATLPMIGEMGSFKHPDSNHDPQHLDLYIHGHVSSRLLKLPENHEAGLPVCVVASILDGIVLALTPFNNSCNYRSAILHGHAEIVTDEHERLFAMKLITNGLVPGRWENSRTPPTKTELNQTQIVRIKVESASVKVRTGGPVDDRRDLKDASVVGTYWTGVLPISQRVGEPQASELNKVAGVPNYLQEWRNHQNTLSTT